MTTLDLPLQSVARRLTLTVRITGQRRFALRCWVAGWLMRLTAWTIGTRLDLTVNLAETHPEA